MRAPDGATPADPEGVEVCGLDRSLGGFGLRSDRAVRPGSELWFEFTAPGDGAPRGHTLRVLSCRTKPGPDRLPFVLHTALI